MTGAREQVHRWANYVRTCRKAGDYEEARYGLHKVWLFRNMARILRLGAADSNELRQK